MREHMQLAERRSCWLDFWTRVDLTDRSLLRRLFAVVSDTIPEAFPTSWGEYEPHNVHATARDYGDVIELAAHFHRSVHGSIPRSKTSMMLTTYITPNRTPFGVSFWIDARKPKLTVRENQDRIIQLFTRWIDVLQPDFARGCMQAEWAAKNTIDNYLDSDGFITSPKVFNSDINEGLPGLYWLTYFGRDLTEWFTQAKLATAPWPHITESAGGYFLRRSDDLNSWQLEASLDERLIEHLGPNRFFDIRDPMRKIEALEFRLPDRIIERYREFSEPIAPPAPGQRKAKRKGAVSAKEEAEMLLNEGMPFAEQMLSEHGEFFPFAVVMTTSGEIEHAAIGADSLSSPLEVYERLEQVLRAGAKGKRYRAAALFADRRAQRPTDASMRDTVHAALEHESGYAVDVFFPYSRSTSGDVSVDEPFASERTRNFFLV